MLPTLWGSNLGAEQTTFRQCLLSFARPQRCIRAKIKPLSQARRLEEVKEALTDFVNAGRRLRQCPPFAPGITICSPAEVRSTSDMVCGSKITEQGESHSLERTYRGPAQSPE